MDECWEGCLPLDKRSVVKELRCMATMSIQAVGGWMGGRAGGRKMYRD